MTAGVESFIGGIEVEIPEIDHELKKLWDEGGGAMTRASLVNFAIFCEGVENMRPNTELISQITENHACRAILIVSDDKREKDDKVQAWISAHCHVGRAGAKQICSEQITFLLSADSHDLIPNIVFSHLDSDLPLYLWWRDEFPPVEDMPLLTWVDRLIMDSHRWDNCGQRLRELPGHLATLPERTTFRDMNWTRSLALRQTLARIFDHPDNMAELKSIRSIQLFHSPEYHSTAALLAGWLASRLGWTITANGATTADGAPVAIKISKGNGPAVNGCTIESDNATFGVTYDDKSKFLKAAIAFRDGRAYSFPRPAGNDDQRSLLDEELGKQSSDLIYVASLRAAEALFL